jgi:hypothetical protein
MTQITAEQSRTGRLLREQPTSILGTDNPDPLELIKELQSLGVVKKPVDEAIDVQVVEE